MKCVVKWKLFVWSSIKYKWDIGKLYLLTDRLRHLLNQRCVSAVRCILWLNRHFPRFLLVCVITPSIFFLLNNFYDKITKTRTILTFDRYEQRRIFAYHAHKLGCQWRLITWTKKIIAPVAFLVSLLHFCVALKKPLFSPPLYPQGVLLACGRTLLSNSRG